MARTVRFGNPAETGQGANDLVTKVFANATYPLKVTIKNHMPMDVALDGVEGGLFLRHVANEAESQMVGVIPSADHFHRFAADVEQLAMLNNQALAMTVTEVAASAPAASAAETTRKLKGEQP